VRPPVREDAPGVRDSRGIEHGAGEFERQRSGGLQHVGEPLGDRTSRSATRRASISRFVEEFQRTDRLAAVTGPEDEALRTGTMIIAPNPTTVPRKRSLGID
jgi:hypothetical protein